MLRQFTNRFALLALCGAFSLPMARAQDDDQSNAKPEKDKPSVKKTITVRAASGKHWIGVMAVPIDDALKAQMNLKDRLIVHHVLPDSPAGKAGLQTHDILLKYGDKEISSLNDLVAAVGDNKEKDATLVVLRGGKEVTLSIKPSERPAEERLHELLPQGAPEALKLYVNKLENGDSFFWRGVGPGVLSRAVKQKTEFPAGLSITISREADKPALIIAKKDGKTYETTAEKLDILPEDIRGHIQRLLHGPQIAFGSSDGKPDGALRLQLNTDLKELEAKKHELKAESDANKAVRQHVEIRKLESGSFSELKKEIESLRRAVEELKVTKGNKNSDSKDDSDKKDKADRD